MNSVIEYSVGINPNRLVIRPSWLHKSKYRSQSQINNQVNLSHNQNTGKLSNKSKHKLINGIHWMVLSSYTTWILDKSTGKSKPFKIAFFTLTIPFMPNQPSISDTNSKLLIPLLKSLRKYYGLNTYVWKAELQKNKMPHYHITCNVYIPYKSLLKIWNRLLEKAGYLDAFRQREGNKVPNSVDCKSVKHVNNLAAYLAKYLSKDVKDVESSNTRKWGLSSNLSKAINTKGVIMPDRIYEVSKGVNRFTSFYADNKGCEVFYINPNYYSFKPAEEIWSAMLKSINLIRGIDSDLFTVPDSVEIAKPPPPPSIGKTCAPAQPKLF